MLIFPMKFLEKENLYKISETIVSKENWVNFVYDSLEDYLKEPLKDNVNEYLENVLKETLEDF